MLCAMIIIAIITFVYFKLKNFFTIPSVPYVEEKWWGKGEHKDEEVKIEPFKIEVEEEVIKDLKHRLDIALPFQEPMENAKQHYGFNTNLLKEIVDFWKTQYDWREREKYLNKFPQYKMNIQGLKIHYIHAKPETTEGVKVRPLLLVHGWPGSVREFYEIIPLLTTPKNGVVFEVIAPSLPGYGFSDYTTKQGLSPLHMAVIFKNLMKNLGFSKYYIQGGDWGSAIVHDMALFYPDYLLGMHTNMATSQTPKSVIKMMLAKFIPWYFATEGEKTRLDIFDFKKKMADWGKEKAYFDIQSTKPDTVGVGLRDSPVGLAAYILEKFITWTDPAYKNLDDGGLKSKYTYTNLLDNIMIYWVTRSITTSVRIYYEYKSDMPYQLNKIPIEHVPCGVARFWKDIMAFPEAVLRDKYLKLVHISEYDNGHFPAFEVPDVLAKDIFEFVSKCER